MMVRKARVLFFVAPALAAALALAHAGCSGQGEGERCEYIDPTNNGNDDCASPLICYKASDLNGSNTARCCPADLSQATTAICHAPSTGGTNQAPPDSGVDASTTGDAAADANTDAADAATEAATADAADAGDADDGAADAPGEGG